MPKKEAKILFAESLIWFNERKKSGNKYAILLDTLPFKILFECIWFFIERKTINRKIIDRIVFILIWFLVGYLKNWL